MDLFQALILGIVQGATEILPISSSAHLILVPHFFSWPDPGLAFDVALHFGTLIAVVLYLKKEIVEIVAAAWNEMTKKEKQNQKINSKYPKKFLWMLALATIPGVLAGYFLENLAETFFRNPVIISGTLAIFGLALYLVDKIAFKSRQIENLSWKNTFVIGLAQALAIIPGVSRSGITITAGLLSGMKREAAAKFSFLLSVPIVFGAAANQADDFFKYGFGVSEIVGIIASALSGYLAIWWLVKFVQKTSYAIFFWYRLALALLILTFYFLGF